MVNFLWGTLKLLNLLVKSCGSAGTRTPDHLIKSQIITVNHNNTQLIKDVISVRCLINNKLQYCTYLWSSATNLQHYRPPTTPYGVPPPLCYYERDTIPRKNILATSYYKNWWFYLEGVWLWRISGVVKPTCFILSVLHHHQLILHL